MRVLAPRQVLGGVLEIPAMLEVREIVVKKGQSARRPIRRRLHRRGAEMPGEGENREGLFVGFDTGIGMGAVAGHGENKPPSSRQYCRVRKSKPLIGASRALGPRVAWVPAQQMGVAVDIDLACLDAHALVCIQHGSSVEGQLLDKTAGIHIQSGM